MCSIIRSSIDTVIDDAQSDFQKWIEADNGRLLSMSVNENTSTFFKLQVCF